ncbi:hypothetical protein [Kitasatospora cheerisanensis]|uniref:Uncharacterized protein n=1 Tax=Kitasatospora cheerisanensis KCTC 2395 TaxID=1348663 RepID=A0A066YG73_9ACTN|nr:hypothetical protein [Kitasatospora cheerisanensis]KDN80498.1 hypothetical protein KCH_77320 [Kitasatospora cheerisanensis KCTC 2395]
MAADPATGLLHHDDAYTVVLASLGHLESLGRRRTTIGDLHTWSRTLSGGEALGGHRRLMTLLRQAADHGQVRLALGEVHIGDAPTGGGPGHVWMHQPTKGGAAVELIGPEPWPAGTPARPGTPAWWHCTGCRDGRTSTEAAALYTVRQDVAAHAAACAFLPPLPHHH